MENLYPISNRLFKIYNPHSNASIKVGQMKSVKYLSDADYSYYRKKLRLVWANHFNSRGVCKDDFSCKINDWIRWSYPPL